MHTFFIGLDDKEKLSRQRQMLNKKLGLDMVGSLKLGLDSDLFSDEDLTIGISSSNGSSSSQINVKVGFIYFVCTVKL